MDNTKEFDKLIEPSPTTTDGGNEDFGDLIEPPVEDETKKGPDPNERWTKKPHNKVKAQNRKRNKLAKKSRRKNRK